MGFINVTRINNFAMKRNTSMVHVHCTYGPLFNFFGHKQGKELFQEIL